MTTISTPEEFSRFAKAQVRGQCRLLAAGLTAKGVTKRRIADMAGKITGKKYKLSELEQAAEDITKVLDDVNV